MCVVCLVVGGNIASSWAVLHCMGEDGYMDIARRLMQVAERMKNGINTIKVNFILIFGISVLINHTIAGSICVWHSSYDNTLL